MLYENLLLSKVIDEQNFFILKKYNIAASDFSDAKPVYKFIEQYVKSNKGQIPDFRTVVDKTGFDYEPEVADTFSFLCKEVKSQSAKRQAYKMLQEDATKNFSNMNGFKFIKWLQTETDKIVKETDYNSSEGSNFATNGLERKQWYEDSKFNRSHIIVPTPFEGLNDLLSGGNELGDYLLIQAYTNRGKSWIASDFGLSAWTAGFTVLHYSPELSKRQQLNRLDTLYGHFKNTELRNGTLQDETSFTEYLEQFNEEQNTDYIVKTMEDIDKLDVDIIENDIVVNPEIKVVIIDGFNLMSHTSRDKNSRNAMSNTSRRLRQIFGKYGVLGILVHQTPTSAEKDNIKKDEVGDRLPNPAQLFQYSETIAVVQDACTVLSFDQIEGIGMLLIAKARQPCVDETIDLLCNFNEGYITEHKEPDFDF